MMTACEDPRARVDALFAQALEHESDARNAFLDRVTEGQPTLRAELDTLLRLVDTPAPQLEPQALAEGTLWQAVAEALQPVPQAPAAHATGRQVGAWRLLHELGRGGMGTVYLAERASGGFEQRGALKLIRSGVDSDEFLRRFAQERQILASLDHPGIARLLDGGRDEDGQPYLVMEYVEGLPLDRYCDGQRLDIEQRVVLFIRVGRAVAHAHQHLIVHRDLKPSNIVVTAEGEVKLLDFGIAKALSTTGTPAEPLTRTRARVFTPEYAAPEQVLGRPVSTTTDVYQLGLLLYELLCGQRVQEVADDSQATLERVVCAIEPAMPSQRIDGAGDTCDARRTTPAALRRRLRGDLDNIVLKALRKAPGRRYQSATALAEDLERWRLNRPVQARPERLGYRARKFMRRHPVGILASAALLTLLLVYTATVTRQAATIAHERDRAQAEATKARQVQALVLKLFEGANPELSGGTAMTARELLDRGWDGIAGELEAQPDIRAELLDTIGEAYRQLGDYDRARPLFEQALALAGTNAQDEPRQLARALRSMGRLQRDLGDYERAGLMLRDALAEYRHLLEEPHADIADTLRDLGYTLTQSTRYAEAEQVHRDALAMRRDLFGNEHPDVADSLVMLGMALRNQGDYPAAEPLLTEALAIRRRLLPPTHPHLAYTLSDLAMLREDLGEYDSAESLYRESLSLIASTHGQRHPYVATVMNNLARLLRGQSRLDEAAALLLEAVEIRRQALGDTHQAVALSLHDLGRVRAEAGDIESAREYFQRALDTYDADHPWRAATISTLGRLAGHQGDLATAERLFRQALAGQRAHYGADHDRSASVQLLLGQVLHQRGDLDQAESELRQALWVFRSRLRPDHPRMAEAQEALGVLLAARGARDEAAALLQEAVRIRRAVYGEGDERTLQAARALARISD